MRNVLIVLLAAAAPLLNPGTESKWKVMKGATHLGTITVLTSSSASRAEWKTTDKAAPEVFIGTSGKAWMRSTGVPCTDTPSGITCAGCAAGSAASWPRLSR